MALEEKKDMQTLLAEISSRSPAPGGGSVAAISGSLGAALVSMVCRLSIGKEKYQNVEVELEEVLDEAESLRHELFALSKEDVEAFNGVMASYKADYSNEEEKKESIQGAYREAADVPLRTASACLRILELSVITTDKGNANAVTDSGVGALMACSGLKGAIFNVKINLKYIEDRDYAVEIGNRAAEMEIRSEEILKKVIELVESSVNASG